MGHPVPGDELGRRGGLEPVHDDHAGAAREHAEQRHQPERSTQRHHQQTGVAGGDGEGSGRRPGVADDAVVVVGVQLRSPGRTRGGEGHDEVVGAPVVGLVAPSRRRALRPWRQTTAGGAGRVETASLTIPSKSMPRKWSALTSTEAWDTSRKWRRSSARRRPWTDR